MRITNSMMVSQFLRDSNAGLNRVAKAQQQVQSTKRINNIADDPLATVATLQAKNRLSALANYQSAAKTSRSYLKQAETSSGDLNDLIQSVYVLMDSAANDTKELEDRQAIAQEIYNLRNELFHIGNTSVGTTYIFGGDTVTKPPFQMDGEHLIYNGIDMNNLGLEEDYYAYWDNVNTLSAELEEIYNTLGDANTNDSYAKNSLCERAVDTVKDLITNLEAAYNAAKEYSDYGGALGGGTDATNNAAKLEEMRKGIDSIKEVVEQISSEKSKDLTPADTSGMTPEELDNCFSRTEAQAIIGSLANALGFNSGATTISTASYGIATASITSSGTQVQEVATIFQPSGLEPTDTTHGIKFEYSNFKDLAGQYADTTGYTFNLTLADSDDTDGMLTFTADYGGETYVATVDLNDPNNLQYGLPTTLTFRHADTNADGFTIDVTPIQIDSSAAGAAQYAIDDLQSLPLMSQKDFVGGTTIHVDNYDVTYTQPVTEIAPDETAVPTVNGVKITYSDFEAVSGIMDAPIADEIVIDNVAITGAGDDAPKLIASFTDENGVVQNFSATLDLPSLQVGTPMQLEFTENGSTEVAFRVTITPERVESATPPADDYDIANFDFYNDGTGLFLPATIGFSLSTASSGGTSSGGITNGTTGVTETPSPTNPPDSLGSIGAALSDASVQYTESFIEVPKVNEDGSISSTMKQVGELFEQLSGDVMDIQIGASATMNSSANGFELLGKSAANYFYMFDKCCKILNGELDTSMIGDMISELQQAITDNSTLRTRFGTSLERLDMVDARYTDSELTYEDMRSQAEDVDLAEAITEWMTAKNVYEAALAAGGQTIQISLLDFVQ